MKRQKRNGSGNPEGRTYQFPFGKLRAPCREPRQIWRFRKDAPRASRCPRRGQRQGRKISPRSQRRKATTRSDAKRSRPESEACLDRMSERSTVASRRAGGISPWWSRVCLFWPLGGRRAAKKKRDGQGGAEVRKKALEGLLGEKGEGERVRGGIPPPYPPLFFKKRGAIFQAHNLIKFLKNFVLVFCNVCAGVPQHLFDNFSTNN